MKLKYINKIKSYISMYSSIKSMNLLDGKYKSIYKGRSMVFDNLREYVINDDIKDVDWKSSARSGTLYVKQFVAERNHNFLFVMDTGKKMMADTDALLCKKDVALYSMGVLGYLAINNKDYVGMLYSNNKFIYKPFRHNLYNLEEYLCEYDKNVSNHECNINELLHYVENHLLSKMIIVIITDIVGVNSIDISLLNKIKIHNDILIININDTNMTGHDVFDIDYEKYIPNYFLMDKKLNRLEKNIKEKLYENNYKRLLKCGVVMVSISSIDDIEKKIIKLLEEYKYANKN